MIDSHTHLDFCEPPNAELVEQCRAAGVKRLLTVGTEPDSCRAALRSAEDFEEVYAAIGRHPNSTARFDSADLADIEALGHHEKCVGIGESGLDYYRAGASPSDQMRAFHAHIEVARALDKPLIVHTRSADDDTLNELGKRARDITVLLHCFSMPERLEECLDLGFTISFAGNVTYPNAQDIAAACERVPDDRILVETDAPYLTPQTVRKHRNRPEFVAHTARFVAERRGQTYAELEAVVEANAARVFGW